MKTIFSILFLLIFSVGFSQKKWSLKECIDYAMTNNLEITNKHYYTEIANKDLEIAKKASLPIVSGTLNNDVYFAKTKIADTNVRQDFYNNSANLTGSIEIYNKGRIRKNAEKYQYELDASMLDTEKFKNDISIQITQLYLQVLLNKEVKKIANESVANAEKILDKAKITTIVGTTPKTIEAEAIANLAREKQKQKSAEIEIQRSIFSLAMVLQIAEYENFDVEEIAIPNIQENTIEPIDTILKSAYENQPQIKSAEIRILSAKKQTEISETAYYPSVSANVGLKSFYSNYFGSSDFGISNQYRDNFNQQMGVSVTIPIFNKGITKLQVEQSKIAELIAKNTLNVQKVTLLQEIQKVYFDCHAHYENYKTALETEKSTKLALEFAEKSYEAGVTTIYDFNISRINYVNAQSSVSQNKYNYIFSKKLLNFFAGSPFSNSF